MLREALYYEKLDDMSLNCLLCPHGCTISEGKSGICGVRRNKGGTLYTENYGMAAAIAMDPVEKSLFITFTPASICFQLALSAVISDAAFARIILLLNQSTAS